MIKTPTTTTTIFPETKACKGDMFRCMNGVCIEGKRQCDGINDCNDRSDEINCSMQTLKCMNLISVLFSLLLCSKTFLIFNLSTNFKLCVYLFQSILLFRLFPFILEILIIIILKKNQKNQT